MREMTMNTFFGPDLKLLFDELLGAFGKEAQRIATKIDGVFFRVGFLGDTWQDQTFSFYMQLNQIPSDAKSALEGILNSARK